VSSSEYINDQRREYSLYVLQSRAIPHAADGLKAAARRVLWVGRDSYNKKFIKSATLAGATLPIHPHAPPESAVNTLAAPFGNNLPLLEGDGAFGTLLSPTAYGASRYTSVRISEFCKDVVFRDIEVIPMKPNYDDTQEEPAHFLPLVPIVLLNPSEGIAVGFASKIRPRTLESIIFSQIQHLTGKEVQDVYPAFVPTNSYCEEWIEAKDGTGRWVFRGEWKKKDAVTINISNLPYSVTHEDYEKFLDKLEESGNVVDIENNSRDVYNIDIKFKKGVLSRMKPEEIEDMLGLRVALPENLNVINFDGKTIVSTDYVEMIKNFSDWRLCWYKDRYQRLADLLTIDIQKYKDILLAIKKNVGGIARKINNRGELKEFLTEIGVVHINYIADLPVYRFTEEEKKKVEEKLKEANATMRGYRDLLKSEAKRREVYINELKDVLKKYNKGIYNIEE